MNMREMLTLQERKQDASRQDETDLAAAAVEWEMNRVSGRCRE